MNGHCSNCPVEPQCGYEYKPCDCRDRLKFKPKAAEQPDQPTPFDVPAMNHIARRKLGELVADGHDVCGLMIQRQNADGTFTRGAVSAGGMVIWWHPEQASVAQQKPLTDEQDRALCEAYCNAASDEYFKARPQLDSDVNRRIFCAGHRKAWIEWQAAHGIKE